MPNGSLLLSLSLSPIAFSHSPLRLSLSLSSETIPSHTSFFPPFLFNHSSSGSNWSGAPPTLCPAHAALTFPFFSIPRVFSFFSSSLPRETRTSFFTRKERAGGGKMESDRENKAWKKTKAEVVTTSVPLIPFRPSPSLSESVCQQYKWITGESAGESSRKRITIPNTSAIAQFRRCGI